MTEQANKGVLATTARFTDPAKDYFSKNPWILEGRDFDGPVEWLDLYHKYQMGKIIRPR